MQRNGIGVQSPLVNGSDIKRVNNNNLLTTGNYNVPSLGSIKMCKIISSDGVSITSNTNTITYSILIPANTFSSSGLIDLAYRLQKTGGTTSSWAVRIYTNTSNSLTGATYISNLSNAGGTVTCFQGFRYFRLNNGNIHYLNTGLSTLSDQGGYSTGESSSAFNLAVDNYIMIAIQKTVANAEICRGLFCRALGY